MPTSELERIMAESRKRYGSRWRSRVRKWHNSVVGIFSEISLVVAISLISLLIMIIVRAIVI